MMSRALLALLLLTLGACKEEKEEKKRFVEKPTPVVVELVKRSTMSDALLSTSTVDSKTSIEILAEVPGVLTRIWVDQGDVVKKGARLAKIQRADLGLSVRSASTSVGQLGREVTRLKPLFEKGIVSRQIYDNAIYQFDQAKVEQSRAKNAASNARVKATSPGLIAMRYVNPGQQVALGTPLFKIIDPEHLIVNIHLPERVLSGQLLGRKVFVESDAVGIQAQGVVERVSPIVDPRSGTVGVRIAIENNSAFRSGMFVRTKLVTHEKENVLVLPRRALIYQEDSISVFVQSKKNDRVIALRRKVEVGLKDGSHAEITKGLEEGDKVIIIGQETLKDGTLITLGDVKNDDLKEEKNPK